jgi:hypothetical protein
MERSLNMYGFKCNCKFCQLDENDPMRLIREKLLVQLESKMTTGMISLGEILAYLQKFRLTYQNRGIKNSIFY